MLTFLKLYARLENLVKKTRFEFCKDFTGKRRNQILPCFIFTRFSDSWKLSSKSKRLTVCNLTAALVPWYGQKSHMIWWFIDSGILFLCTKSQCCSRSFWLSNLCPQVEQTLCFWIWCLATRSKGYAWKSHNSHWTFSPWTEDKCSMIRFLE